jgi:hypothetical protein
MSSPELSEKDRVWAELHDVNCRLRDLEHSARWLGRKRDESIHPEDYVAFSNECNKILGQQCELGYKASQLHCELVRIMNETNTENRVSEDSVIE